MVGGIRYEGNITSSGGLHVACLFKSDQEGVVKSIIKYKEFKDLVKAKVWLEKELAKLQALHAR